MEDQLSFMFDPLAPTLLAEEPACAPAAPFIPTPPSPVALRLRQPQTHLSIADIATRIGFCPTTICTQSLEAIIAWTSSDALAAAREEVVDQVLAHIEHTFSCFPDRLVRWTKNGSMETVFRFFLTSEVFRRFPELRRLVPPQHYLGSPIPDSHIAFHFIEEGLFDLGA